MPQHLYSMRRGRLYHTRGGSLPKPLSIKRRGGYVLQAPEARLRLPHHSEASAPSGRDRVGLAEMIRKMYRM